MRRFVDVSMPVGPDTPVWPATAGVATRRVATIGPDSPSTNSVLKLDAHCGTHIDAPLHFVPDGATVDQIGLDACVGPAWVADVDADAIDGAALEAARIPRGTERLLLKTPNSERPALRHAPFQEDFAAVVPDGARWLVERGIRLVGIDYLSIQRFHDPPDTHRILLGASVVILEGLRLSGVAPGPWELLCLPLHLVGTEAAPARVLLAGPESGS